MSPKVTVKPGAPAADQQAAESHLPDNVIIDSRGRRLVIEDPDFLTESRIMRALGEASVNTGYVLGYVMPAVRVVQIDDVRVPYPSTLQQIEAAIGRVGREGTAAVLARDQEKFDAAIKAAQNGGSKPGASAEAEALKNS